MAVGHKTWTVRSHEPIEELSRNLWRVEGLMTERNRRVMILARLRDGRIVVHNSIALDELSMAKIDAWGEVAAILVPNGFHRQDALIMQQRYPKAKVYSPTGAVKAASKATPCAGTYADAPSDDTVTLRDLDGVGKREGVMMVESDDGASAVFCDTLLNLPKLGGVMGMFLHPTGVLSVPRMTTLVFAKDTSALRSDLERIAATDRLVRVIPGHGRVVSANAPAQLREAAARL